MIDPNRRGIPDFTRFGQGFRPVDCESQVLSVKNWLKMAVSMLKRKVIVDFLMIILGTIWFRPQLPVLSSKNRLKPDVDHFFCIIETTYFTLINKGFEFAEACGG